MDPATIARLEIERGMAPSEIHPLRRYMRGFLPVQGPLLLRIQRMMDAQRHRAEENSLEFWKTYVMEFFSEKACLRFVGRKQEWGSRHFAAELPRELLPRFFKVKFDDEVLDEYMFLDNASEIVLRSGALLLDCANVIIIVVCRDMKILNYGHLRVTFEHLPPRRVLRWEFASRALEHIISREALIQKSGPLAHRVPGSPVNEIGLTHAMARMLVLSNVVGHMSRLMEHTVLRSTGPLCVIRALKRGVVGMDPEPEAAAVPPPPPLSPPPPPSVCEDPTTEDSTPLASSEGDGMPTRVRSGVRRRGVRRKRAKQSQ